MSEIFTMAALGKRPLPELRKMFHQAQQELVQSRPASDERRTALANLENLGRAIAQRHQAPRP